MEDYWPIGDVEIDIPCVRYKDKCFIYIVGADLRTYHYAEISETATQDSIAKRTVFKGFDAEKTHGQWNEIELIVMDSKSLDIQWEICDAVYNSRNGTSQ